MRPKLLNERGQALILIAFAAIALFAITGLAIDGSAKLSDRRHAQNAADTAAVAGALEMAQQKTKGNGVGNQCPSGSSSSACLAVITVAKNRAADNSYSGDLVTSTVNVYVPPISGIYSGCGDPRFDCKDYVQVVITSTKPTWFMRVLGITKTTNEVSAVASAFSQKDFFDIGGSAVVALSPEGCALMSQGNTSVTVVGGGLYSNSIDSSCAFKKDTCAGVTNVVNTNGTTGTISMVGGASVNTGCPPSANLSAGAAKQIPFPPPYTELPVPAVCADPVVNIAGNPSAATLRTGALCCDAAHFEYEGRYAPAGNILHRYKNNSRIHRFLYPDRSILFDAGCIPLS